MLDIRTLATSKRYTNKTIIEAETGNKTSDIKDNIVSFTIAKERENISSNETLSTILGKIMKWFFDLKSVAFTGSYNDLNDKPELFSGDYADLNNKPTIPTLPNSLKNPYALKFTGLVSVTYDGSAAKTVNIPNSTIYSSSEPTSGLFNGLVWIG